VRASATVPRNPKPLPVSSGAVEPARAAVATR